jgi:signal transduction histidine kinase/DNA-binding response OmpR family regulator
MGYLKKVLLLFCLLIISHLGLFNHAWAKNSKLESKLIEISQQVNKNEALKTLLRLSKQPNLNAGDKTEILLHQSQLLFTLHQYDEGISVANQAIDIASKNGFFGLRAKLHKKLGILFYYQGELKLSLKAYQVSLTYYEENQTNNVNKFAIERADLVNNIALVYTQLGEFNLALINYQLAESLYAQYGDEVDKIDVRHNIASLHINLRRFDSAIDMLKVIIEKRQQLNDVHGVATARADLGIAYKLSGQFKLAKENVLAALAYFKKHDYKHNIASQLQHMAEISNETFDIEQAVFYAQQALIVSNEVGNQITYAGSLQSLAKASFYSGDLVKAEEYIDRSIVVGKKNDYQILLTENLAISSLISASQQQFVKAFLEHQGYEKSNRLFLNKMLNDKLASFESEQLNQKIVELETRRKVQDLQSVKIEQQRNIVILTLVLILVITFFIYRRYLEQRLTDELELRVKQRTHALENLTKELEKADQVKNQFLANMSHEIRTPLTAIVGHAEAIIHGDVDKNKVQEDIEVIHGNSLHLLDLINDILDLSRIEANKCELEIQPLNLAELIQDLSHTFTAQAQQKQLNFTVEHTLPSPFIIEMDSLRLKQILLNLCANAIKFTEKGHVTLMIDWKDEQLSFTVIDTGIGLSEEHIAQVFELFTQADNSISRRFGGSGLGLSLSNQLAKLMSGNIVVSSQLGQGSSFCLTLPCQYDESYLIDRTNTVTIKDDDMLFTGTILLAEDHDDNRRLIARLLTSLGLDVIVASNGKEAVQLCLKHQPSLVLLDIQMPEMDGVDAFKALRDLGCKQPIYALTANAMSHEVSKYLGLGFTGHLKKPIERKNFIAIIAKYFTISTENTALFYKQNNLQTVTADYKLTKAEENLSEVDLSDLVAEFKENLSNDKQALTLHSDNDDIKKLAHVAHQLAGAAQMFGFVELNQAAKDLETIIKKELTIAKPNYPLIYELTHCLVDEIQLIEQQPSY